MNSGIHILGYEINNDLIEGYKDKDIAYPLFPLTIDSKSKEHSLLIYPLELSVDKDGFYPILNCGCGEFGCGGLYVHVTNEPDYIIWDDFVYHPEAVEKVSKYALGIKAPIKFDRKQYTSIISELLSLKSKYRTEEVVYSMDKEVYLKENKFNY